MSSWPLVYLLTSALATFLGSSPCLPLQTEAVGPHRRSMLKSGAGRFTCRGNMMFPECRIYRLRPSSRLGSWSSCGSCMIRWSWDSWVPPAAVIIASIADALGAVESIAQAFTTPHSVGRHRSRCRSRASLQSPHSRASSISLVVAMCGDASDRVRQSGADGAGSCGCGPAGSGADVAALVVRAVVVLGLRFQGYQAARFSGMDPRLTVIVSMSPSGRSPAGGPW